MAKRELFVREKMACAGSIKQYNKLLLTRILINEPVIIWVTSGKKTLRQASKEIEVNAGEFILIAAEQTFDVLNEPDSHSGVYSADWISFSKEVIELFSTEYGLEKSIVDSYYLLKDVHHFDKAFNYTLDIIRDHKISQDILKIRLYELLMWLKCCKVSFNPYHALTLSQEISKIILSDVTMKWNAPMIANRLNVSEATLRRNLSKEDNSFQKLLVDVRMTRALTLLQVTEWAISQIAYAVGYDSPSRFTARFKQRFGFVPSDVRTPILTSPEIG
ncbi:MAG TPA: AraC family transcriptional regulator [Pasteurellaceae bacterium]|nr:AraC family transcriptional regulator [Pasteurellaceae bacterium]